MVHTSAHSTPSLEAVAMLPGRRYCIIGGAGFIGSHFVDRLMDDPTTGFVTAFDNFQSGRLWHLQKHMDRAESRFRLVRGDVHDKRQLQHAMSGHDVVIHLASNADIARAAEDPEIDFREGTELTQQVAEVARRCSVSRILYASGSGVYGDAGLRRLREDDMCLRPVSTYGASKIAGEAIIASYCAMYDMTARVFRFANVVGRRQTHGVGYDFLRKLQENPKRLRILGDGSQSKSYIHVSDVVEAVLLADGRSDENYAVYNVSTEDAITVTEIAELAAEVAAAQPAFDFTGGDRGWKGDVPIVRLDSSRLRALGWAPQHSSRQAIRLSLMEMMCDENPAFV